MTTFRNILVATDLSPECAVVTERAAVLARRTGAQLVVLHVGWTQDAIGAIAPHEAGAAELREIAKESMERDEHTMAALEKQMTTHHLLTPVFITRDGYADMSILAAAEELGSDLLVLGTHGRTGLSRFFMGSVAERVVRQSRCPVLIVRPAPKADDGFHHILVPVDFSEHTEPAIETAVKLVSEGGHIELFHTIELPSPRMETERWLLTTARKLHLEQAQDRCRELAAEYKRKTAGVTFDIVDGRPASAIIERLEGGPYDLCVLGSHGRRGLKRALLGSVAERVVRHAPCSVAIARHCE